MVTAMASTLFREKFGAVHVDVNVREILIPKERLKYGAVHGLELNAI